jgi:hypothetical protein
MSLLTLRYTNTSPSSIKLKRGFIPLLVLIAHSKVISLRLSEISVSIIREVIYRIIERMQRRVFLISVSEKPQ